MEKSSTGKKGLKALRGSKTGRKPDRLERIPKKERG
jgi:hypothetical protein